MILVLGQVPMWLVMLLVILFLGVCVLMILTVLIQKPQGGGLAGAFGSGAGSGQTAFGAKTGDALTIATIIMFCVFVLGAVGLNYLTRPPKAPTVTPMTLPGGGGSESPGTSTPPQPQNNVVPTPQQPTTEPGQTPPGAGEQPTGEPTEPPPGEPAEPPTGEPTPEIPDPPPQ